MKVEQQMRPSSKTLHGWTLTEAEAMGKPHLGAHYTAEGRTDRYGRDVTRCCMCGRVGCNTHHVAGRTTFTMKTPRGEWRLRSALAVMCGSGTTGCHGAVEHNRAKIAWRWYTMQDEDLWWSGELLEKYGPHSPELYFHGYWLITDENGMTFHYKGAKVEERPAINNGDTIVSTISGRRAKVEKITEGLARLRMENGEVEWVERCRLSYWEVER